VPTEEQLIAGIKAIDEFIELGHRVARVTSPNAILGVINLIERVEMFYHADLKEWYIIDKHNKGVNGA